MWDGLVAVVQRWHEKWLNMRWVQGGNEGRELERKKLTIVKGERLKTSDIKFCGNFCFFSFYKAVYTI